MDWKLTLAIVILPIMGWLARSYLGSYTKKKGENLATKEDIGEITRTVEEIKSELATSMEFIRWELNKKATIHRLAAEKEFEALSEIGKCLFELQESTEELRPTGLRRIDPEESEEDTKTKYQERQKRWRKDHDAFVTAVQHKRLFMPQSLPLQFFNIGRLAHNELIDFQTALAYGKGASQS